MAADKIYGKSGNKNHQHGIDDQGGRPGINPDDEGKPCEKFQERYDDGNQVDEHGREKVIPVNNFSKSGRRQNLVITGIYKGQPKYPANRQFDPAVVV